MLKNKHSSCYLVETHNLLCCVMCHCCVEKNILLPRKPWIWYWLWRLHVYAWNWYKSFGDNQFLQWSVLSGTQFNVALMFELMRRAVFDDCYIACQTEKQLMIAFTYGCYCGRKFMENKGVGPPRFCCARSFSGRNHYVFRFSIHPPRQSSINQVSGHLTTHLSAYLSVCPPAKLPGIIVKMHGTNCLNFGIMMFSLHLHSCSSFWSVAWTVVKFQYSEIMQVRGFSTLSLNHLKLDIVP